MVFLMFDFDVPHPNRDWPELYHLARTKSSRNGPKLPHFYHNLTKSLAIARVCGKVTVDAMRKDAFSGVSGTCGGDGAGGDKLLIRVIADRAIRV